ncbi:MAG: hypothetical protein NTX03_11725 [Bacteroidetes bacterium]|nr:hypothetical protein [Bacteroidota bacterium]
MIKTITLSTLLFVEIFSVSSLDAQNKQTVKSPPKTTTQTTKKPVVNTPPKNVGIEDGVYTDMVLANKTPDKVLKLRIEGGDRVPDDVKNFKNLQELTVKGPFTMDEDKPYRPNVPMNVLTPPDEPQTKKKPNGPRGRRPGGKTSEIPGFIYTLTNLTSLSLTGLNLGNISPEISKLTKLRTLNLNDNPINMISEEIGKLSNLEELDVLNSFGELPKTLEKLSKLKTLSTGAKEIPNIKTLEVLKLKLEGNLMPEALSKCQTIKKLYLVGEGAIDFNMMAPIIQGLHDIRVISMPGVSLALEDLKNLENQTFLEEIEIKSINPGRDAQLNGFLKLKKLTIHEQNMADPSISTGLFKSLESFKALEELSVPYSAQGISLFKKMKKVSFSITGMMQGAELGEMKDLKNIYGLSFDRSVIIFPPTISPILGTVKMLDISECTPQLIQSLQVEIDKMTTLEKLVVNSETFPMIARTIKNPTLREINIKKGGMPGPPMPPEMVRNEAENIKKKIPNCKIVSE